MNCYLKVSYLTRHKKYRLWKDKQVNFAQLRRQLLVNLPPQSIMYVIHQQQSSKIAENEGLVELKMDEKQLTSYFKDLAFKENQTIKIKIVEEISRKQESVNQNDSISLNIPNLLDRQRSKSEQISLQRPAMSTKTSTIEVTQQFLCNSSFEYAETKAHYLKGWILRDLENNSRRKKQLEDRKKLTCIPSVYAKLQEVLKQD